MRVFAALVPPETAVEDLGAFVEPRREAGSDLRWTDPQQWHVTLAFMAHVPERSVDALTEEVAAAVAGRAPMALRVEGGGAFPNPYAARVLWAGIEGGDGALSSLASLARGVRQAANHAGASPEGGPFHPHVTLARLRRPAGATRWIRVLESYAGPAWLADEVTLVASHLGEGRGRRPRYENLATIPLAGPR
jgi:2'-5' RNA ligase